MKHLFLPLALLLTLSFGVAAQSVLRVGAPAPQFSGIGLDGTEYDLSQMRGRVVVVTFWTIRCVICKAELPKVNQVVRNYEGKDVIFLALTTDDETRVADHIRTNPQAGQVIPNSFGVLLAFADRDKQGNMNFGYPAYYVIDKEGLVAYRGNGWNRTGSVTSAIDNALAR